MTHDRDDFTVPHRERPGARAKWSDLRREHPGNRPETPAPTDFRPEHEIDTNGHQKKPAAHASRAQA
jgi:hypothetical protein